MIALWQGVFEYDSPHSEPTGALDRKLAVDDLLLVAATGDQVIGTVMLGYDGHRGWIYSLGVFGANRKGGVGRALMQAAEQELKALGCLKINLQVVGTNVDVIGFYENLGFSVEDRVSMGKRL